MKKTIILAAIVGTASLSASAEIRLDGHIGNNMVVQRNSELHLSGKAEGDVTAKASWLEGKTFRTSPSADSAFSINIPTPEAGGPFTISLDCADGSHIELKDILSGEVWLSSGQSNMEMPLAVWGHVQNFEAEIAGAVNYPDIRLLQVNRHIATTPQSEGVYNNGGWQKAAPGTVDNFSSVAYFYARELYNKLGVPVGVIDCSWGGTPAEAWTSLEGCKAIGGLDYAPVENDANGAAYQKYIDTLTAWDVREQTASSLDVNKKQKGWKKMSLPMHWENYELPNFDGIVWFQREVKLPKEMRNKNLTLSLGRMDDGDVTFVNGQKVGETWIYDKVRRYEIPANLTSDKLLISVKVIDNGGGGGIWGMPEEMSLSDGETTIDLSDEWNYKAVFDYGKDPRPQPPYYFRSPSVLYNAMVHPLKDVSLAGVIWYQGCDNVGRDEQYSRLFPRLITDWRTLFNSPNLPFYFVQLAGFLQPQFIQPDSQWAALREAQKAALSLTNTGMATAIDIGEANDIHPKNKQEVARRLALQSLRKTYGLDVVADAPSPTSFDYQGNQAAITFSDEIVNFRDYPKGFIVCTEKGWSRPEVSLSGKTITLKSNAPILEIRYNWADCPDGNLYGVDGLPVLPFAKTSDERAAAALIDRIGGAGASDRFVLTLDERIAPESKETFVIANAGGKPGITGSTLSALTAGIGWYLNHYANVNLTWNYPKTDLVNIDLPLPAVHETHNTDTKYRHYLNYCTFSYSATTWTWERWQQEIDWMALRGINMPLQIVGVEEVWRRTLAESGYNKDEINAFVAGPAYQAWFQMGNVEGIGGPNPDWWYERQAQLGRQIMIRMRELGMEPVLPGIYFVPSNYGEKTGMKTYPTGEWNNHRRPHLPDVDDERFSALAAKFYKNLDSLLGKTSYYSMDPFHESFETLPDNLNPDEIYKGLYKTLTASHPEAKWVIQQWLWTPPQWHSLNNVPEGKLIVLDLFADATPMWNRFGGHDVVFSTIFNFGGRTGLFGRLDTTAKGFENARKLNTVKGIGATPEAIEQTPVIYDHLFELPWYDAIPNTDQWLEDYTRRRYGKDDEHAQRAWSLLKQTALGCPDARQGPHEAVVCARPALEVPHTSSWGSADIFYNPDIVMEAAKELLKADINHPNYDYDLADVARQALTDRSKAILADIKASHESGDTETFETSKKQFLEIILDIDEILATVPDFMLGTWTQRSRNMADEVDGTTDADRDWLEMDNARTLITTWFDMNMANDLHEYAYREWSGMLGDFYYPRWKVWFDNGMKEPDEGWYQWEHDRIRATKSYLDKAVGQTKEIVKQKLEKYCK